MPAQPPASTRTDSGRRGLVVLAILIWLAAAWFYGWSPTDPTDRWLTPNVSNHYHALADGFLAGHLHVTTTPDPMMVRLADPYDPAANAPYRVNDLSYYAGRYYFYPSAVPVLVLFAPVKTLTGQHLLASRASEIFVLGGLALSLVCLLTLHGSFFTSATAPLAVGGMAALALCQGYYVVLRSESYNFVPIGCAYFWVMLSLWALLRAMLAPASGRSVWLATASLGYALAIASRLSYLFGALALLVPILVWWQADGWRFSRSLLGWIFAIALPLAVIGIALMAYNLARFGSATEFGIKYQLGALSTFHAGGLSLANVPANAQHYFVGTGHYHLTFPFVTTSHWAALGVLWHAPVVLLSLLLLAPGRLLPTSGRTVLLPALIVAAANLGFLLLFPNAEPALLKSSANARYVMDFLPAWVLLAAGTVLAVGSAWRARPMSHRWLQATAAALLLVSVPAAISLDLGRLPPESHLPLARLLNRPAWLWQQLHGVAYGPLEVELVLPTDKPDAREPLLAIGTGKEGDLLYVHYDSPHTIRLGFVSISARGPLSDSIAVDYTQPHKFEFHLGSLFPDASHPLMADYQTAQIARLKRWLQVRIDSRIVLDVPVHLDVPRATPPLIGRADFLRDYCTGSFSGRVLTSKRLPLPAPVTSESETGHGPMRLRLKFPAGRAGLTEPLLSTGTPGAGDLLAVSYQDDRSVRFVLDHWGHESLRTAPLPLAFGTLHELEITLGSLLPPSGDPAMASLSPHERQRLLEHVQLRLNGYIVMDTFQPTYPSSPHDVFVGRNILGSSIALEKFTGEIQSVERLPWPAPSR